MNQLELVLRHQNEVKTSSMIIAQVFDKEHKNVLRDIQDIILKCPPDFSRLNFEPSTYRVRGKDYPIYFIGRDGFTMLAMGFTGEKAIAFKLAFIKAFNDMEAILRQQMGTPVIIPVYQARILSDAAKKCPANRWCIFKQASEIMLLIEKEVGSVCEYDLADGSIGSHWSKFRQGKPWARPVTEYYHEFKDKRGLKTANSYDWAEIEHFQVWLQTIYKTQHLYDYLYKKYKNDKFMLPRVEALKPKLLGKAA